VEGVPADTPNLTMNGEGMKIESTTTTVWKAETPTLAMHAKATDSDPITISVRRSDSQNWVSLEGEDLASLLRFLLEVTDG
jgi:hypothetical protein